MSEPIPLHARRADIDDLVAELKSVVYEHAGTISVAEAIGVLEIVKQEIWSEQS